MNYFNLVVPGLLFAHSIFAAPHVIFDSGNTQNMQPYMASVKPPDKTALLQSAVMPKNKNMKRLPVRTPELTPGKVQRQDIHNPYLDTPFFIVGADRLSHQWLIEHKQQLKALNAIGIAVNVESSSQLAALQHSAGGLKINPVKGGKLARQLSLSHYPVLISSGLIEQ